MCNWKDLDYMKQKKHQTIEKVEMLKMPMVNSLFKQIIIYT